MSDRIVIDRRYCGPPRSGNGGYSAGLLAEAYGGSAEVTLRVPPPLERPLDLVRDDDRAELRDGDVVVAEATPGMDDDGLEPPRQVSVDEAREAQASFGGLEAHLFPTCFTCGPDRAPGDGLRIFPGPVGGGVLAAGWTPDASLSVDGETARAAAVWAALDCPSGWAGDLSEARPAVLGRLRVRLRHPVAVGEPTVVLGWPLEDLPKKFLAASALLDASGRVLATARATWVRIDAAAWRAP